MEKYLDVKLKSSLNKVKCMLQILKHYLNSTMDKISFKNLGMKLRHSA